MVNKNKLTYLHLLTPSVQEIRIPIFWFIVRSMQRVRVHRAKQFIRTSGSNSIMSREVGW